jgi:hypothetical protein
MDFPKLRFGALTSLLIMLAPSLLPGSILVGTALPSPGEPVALVCNADCNTPVYWGATGFTVDDRQRLAQEFSFVDPVHVDSVSIGISVSYLSNTDILVFLTDGLETPGHGEGAHILYRGEVPLPHSLTAQTFQLATDLQLNAETSYYLILVQENGANAETNGRTSGMIENAGTLRTSYFANSGLGIDPLVANWTTLASPTIAFELTGTQVPEPSHLGMLSFALVLVILTFGRNRNFGSRSHFLDLPCSSNPARTYSNGPRRARKEEPHSGLM